MSHWNKLRNQAISSRKFVVERQRQAQTHLWFDKSNISLLEKVASEVNLKAIVYNLTRVANVYKPLVKQPNLLSRLLAGLLNKQQLILLLLIHSLSTSTG